MKTLSQFLGLVGGGACLVLSACTTDDTVIREGDLQLEPYTTSKPPVVGDEVQGFDKGKLQTTRIVDVKEGLITFSVIEGARQGCSWTRGMGENRFAPTVSWENCRDGSTGTQTFTKEGNVWPLAVGNTESYKVTGSDQKSHWETTRRCKVEAVVQVKIQEKQYPSYEVVCKDEWNVRTWYISPDLDRTVKFRRRHHTRGVEMDWVAIVK